MRFDEDEEEEEGPGPAVMAALLPPPPPAAVKQASAASERSAAARPSQEGYDLPSISTRDLPAAGSIRAALTSPTAQAAASRRKVFLRAKAMQAARACGARLALHRLELGIPPDALPEASLRRELSGGARLLDAGAVRPSAVFGGGGDAAAAVAGPSGTPPVGDGGGDAAAPWAGPSGAPPAAGEGGPSSDAAAPTPPPASLAPPLIAHDIPLCLFDLRGTCNDPKCPAQHLRPRGAAAAPAAAAAAAAPSEGGAVAYTRLELRWTGRGAEKYEVEPP